MLLPLLVDVPLQTHHQESHQDALDGANLQLRDLSLGVVEGDQEEVSGDEHSTNEDEVDLHLLLEQVVDSQVRGRLTSCEWRLDVVQRLEILLRAELSLFLASLVLRPIVSARLLAPVLGTILPHYQPAVEQVLAVHHSRVRDASVPPSLPLAEIPLPGHEVVLDPQGHVEVAVEMRVRHLEELMAHEGDSVLDVLGDLEVLLVPLVKVHIAFIDGDYLFDAQVIFVFRLRWINFVPELDIAEVEVIVGCKRDQWDQELPKLSLEDREEDLHPDCEAVDQASQSVEAQEDTMLAEDVLRAVLTCDADYEHQSCQDHLRHVDDLQVFYEVALGRPEVRSIASRALGVAGLVQQEQRESALDAQIGVLQLAALATADAADAQLQRLV